MGLGAAVASGFRNYADFRGRARRSEFWWWVLFTTVVNALLGGSGSRFWDFGFFSFGGGRGGVSGLATLFALVTVVPTLAVTWRRLHDTDRSGGWFFIQLVPLVGSVVLFVLLVLDGTWGVNRFGWDPKGRNAAPWGAYPPQGTGFRQY